tara:strand:+ start:1634 stop:3157 length:1524 start_codon:yes stop_codon:yes gene_type:complete
MKRFLPKSLAGQLIAVLLLALVVAQIASFHILRDDRRLAFIFVAQQEVMSRTASVVQLLNETEPALHATIVNAASSRRLKFQLADKSAVNADDEHEGISHFMLKRLAWELPKGVGEVRIAIRDDDDDKDDDDNEDADDDADENDGHNPFWVPSDERRFREWARDRRDDRRFNRRHDRRNIPHFGSGRRGSRIGMTISVATKSGSNPTWLNVYSMIPPTSPAVAIPSLITIAIMAVLLVVIVIFMVRRATRPVAKLADSAERFGRGEEVGLLPEMGPEDIRQATRAFNQMQERLTRFVKDRTRMLAAITHDLRTPITSLRIRAEMIEDEEAREKILETLAEMQSLTEAALDFARQEASDEPTRSIDLVALVDSLCADLADVGQAVEFKNNMPERLPYACHPLALKRALRNVIENAVRYGEQAEVDISFTDQEVCINVSDKGPGIPEDEREQIFEPFFRLEESRSRETGGIGLGLAIARTIIRSHGGDITISDGDQGGARFSLCLPQQN